MARCKSATRKDMVAALESLVEAVKNADEIREFKFCSTNEIEEIPILNDKTERKPSGWTNVNLNIYFKNPTPGGK